MTTKQHPNDALSILVVYLAIIVYILVLCLIVLDDDSQDTSTKVIVRPQTTTTTLPMGLIPPLVINSAVTYETCQEDEVLVPTEYGSETTYVCVTLDDFADTDSIARLDEILLTRRTS